MEADSSSDEGPGAATALEELNESELLEALKDLIDQGQAIVDKLLGFEKAKSKIENLSKLRRRISAELDFLRKILKGDVKVKSSHLQCSNVPYYSSLMSLIERETHVVAVQKVFQLKDAAKPGKIGPAQRIEVDLVSKGGKVWLKVKAMKPQTLQLVWQGQAQSGSKSITEQAKVLLKCAQQHPHHYAAPLVALYFEQGISEDVAIDLQSLGVFVLGQILSEDFEPLMVECPALETQHSQLLLLEKLNTPSSSSSSSSSASHSASISADGATAEGHSYDEINSEFFYLSVDLLPSKKVFLDVTTMLAFVSEVVNGDHSADSSDPVIQAQLEGERKQSSAPILSQFMEGKELFVTSIAKKKFQEIVKLVGGEKEKQRAVALLERLTEVPDDPSDRAKALPRGIKMKDQHICVFGTADKFKATTMTSNYNFVRVAKENGAPFSVYVHPARALTEQKTDYEREHKNELPTSSFRISLRKTLIETNAMIL